jgi:hypothetical protein
MTKTNDCNEDFKKRLAGKGRKAQTDARKAAIKSGLGENAICDGTYQTVSVPLNKTPYSHLAIRPSAEEFEYAVPTFIIGIRRFYRCVTPTFAIASHRFYDGRFLRNEYTNDL